ncbi:MAG: RNA methyltransferase [Oxalobacter sp.]|nr:RNA methyltransferase [Oxalobacter sp.]
MNTLKTDTSIFETLRFVLVETSHPGNVGAAARALKTMGFSRLVLVSPRHNDVLGHPDAKAFASGALDVLANTQIVGSIDEALTGCVHATAVSARLREFSPQVLTPRQFAGGLNGNSPPQALVFGSERYGLPNEVVEQCDTLVNIPANPEHTSLNLAQAVQVLAYECRMAILEKGISPQTGNAIGFHGIPATVDQINGMFKHLEKALVVSGFLNPESPKKLMPRLRRLFSRSHLETEEINILRGIATQIESLAKKAK